MKNPMLARVFGESGDVVPVLASLPRRVFRDRLERAPRDDVQRVVREARGDIIPDDAEDIEDTGASTLTTSLRPIKDVVQEPSYPFGQKELYMAPYTALTAPDITPKALTPIDPSSLPGIQATKFTTTQLQDTAEKPASEVPAPEDTTDKAARAMDVLLGRARTGNPAKTPQQVAQAGQIATESQAQAALGIVSGEALLNKGAEMPPPVQVDGKTIYETARRYF